MSGTNGSYTWGAMATAWKSPSGRRGIAASNLRPSSLVAVQTILRKVPSLCVSGRSVNPSMEGQDGNRKSSRVAPTVQSKLRTLEINWHRVTLLSTRRRNGMASSSFLSASSLNPTGKDLRRSSSSMRRISFFHSIFLSMMIAFSQKGSCPLTEYQAAVFAGL